MIKLGILTDHNEDIIKILNDILVNTSYDFDLKALDVLSEAVDYLITDKANVDLSKVKEALITSQVYDTDLAYFSYGNNGAFKLGDLDLSNDEMDFNLQFNSSVVGHYHLIDNYQESILLPVLVLSTILCLNSMVVEGALNRF